MCGALVVVVACDSLSGGVVLVEVWLCVVCGVVAVKRDGGARVWYGAFCESYCGVLVMVMW